MISGTKTYGAEQFIAINSDEYNEWPEGSNLIERFGDHPRDQLIVDTSGEARELYNLGRNLITNIEVPDLLQACAQSYVEDHETEEPGQSEVKAELIPGITMFDLEGRYDTFPVGFGQIHLGRHMELRANNGFDEEDFVFQIHVIHDSVISDTALIEELGLDPEVIGNIDLTDHVFLRSTMYITNENGQGEMFRLHELMADCGIRPEEILHIKNQDQLDNVQFPALLARVAVVVMQQYSRRFTS